MTVSGAAEPAIGPTPGGRLRAEIAETECEQFYTNFFAGPLPPSPGYPPGLPFLASWFVRAAFGRGA